MERQCGIIDTFENHILCQLNHSDRCKYKSKLKNSLRLYSVNSKTNGRVCLHVIFPPKTLSTVSAGEIGGTVQASNVPQKIVPPGKACAAVWGGAEERADASVAPEMNLQKYLMRTAPRVEEKPTWR